MKYVIMFLRPRQFVYILTIILAIDFNLSDDQFVYRYIGSLNVQNGQILIHVNGNDAKVVFTCLSCIWLWICEYGSWSEQMANALGQHNKYPVREQLHVYCPVQLQKKSTWFYYQIHLSFLQIFAFYCSIQYLIDIVCYSIGLLSFKFQSTFLKRIQLIGETLPISQSGAYIDLCKNLF